MNYRKIYDDLIQSAQLRPDIAFLNGYIERHHIKPRCLGGNNKKENLVKLTAREHFIAHWLLYRIYPENNKLALAFNMMRISSSHGRYYNSRGFAIAKKAMSNAKKGKPAWNRGIPCSAETRAKLSAANKGKPNPMKNKKHSAESKARMSNGKKGKPSPMKNKKHSAKSKAQISARKRGKAPWNKGIPRTADEKAKMCASHRGHIWQSVNEIKALRATGLSYPKIAKDYNCTHSTIRRICLS